MISLKPIFLWKYLGLKRNKTPDYLKRLFYLSFEDALWDILDKKQISKGSLLLIPEFYCHDVENNIKNHGYKIAYYPVSAQLSTTNNQLNIPFDKAKNILEKINSLELLLNFELEDNVWSQKQKVIYLPLGLHLNKNHQLEIINKILQVK